MRFLPRIAIRDIESSLLTWDMVLDLWIICSKICKAEHIWTVHGGGRARLSLLFMAGFETYYLEVYGDSQERDLCRGSSYGSK